MTDFLTADSNLPSYMMVSRFPSGHGNKRNCQNALYYPARPGRLSQKKRGLVNIQMVMYSFTLLIEALAEVLHKSQMTVKTALAVLEKQELIFRKRQGPGQPNRIYVKL